MDLQEALTTKTPRKLLADRVFKQMRADGRGDEADQIHDLIVAGELSSYRLSQVLDRMGYQLGETPIDNYRKRHRRAS